MRMPRSRPSPAHTAALAWMALAGLVVSAQQPWAAGAWRPVLTSAMFVILVAGARAVETLPERASLRAALWGGVALQLVALRVRPWSTDDYLRYVWDGRVLLSGVNPYRYLPGDPALTALRDPWLFPDGETPALNHPTVRTVYPPVAQLFFGGAEALPGGDGRGLTLQVLFAIAATCTALVIMAARRALGNDPRTVVWWAWCPTVVLEAGGNAHIDTLAALFVAAALLAAARQRWVLSGLLVGLATGTKLTPALVGVSLPPRTWLRAGSAALVVVALFYLPFAAGGVDVTGFLGGYAQEEATDRWDLLRPLLPEAVVPAVGLALLALLVVAVSAGWLRSLTTVADRAAAVVGGTWLLLTPAYPWYFLPLVALVAIGASRLWLLPGAAAYLVYAAAALGHSYYLTRVIGYGAAAVVIVVTFWRAEQRFRRIPGAGPARHTLVR